MTKLAQVRDPLLYSVESLLDDEDWGYIFSYSFQVPRRDENARKKNTEKDKKASEGGFENLLDLKREAYLALQHKRFDRWQRQAKHFCSKQGRLASDFDERRTSTFFEIVASGSLDRDPALLLGRTQESSPSIEEAAHCSWLFPTLPGTGLSGNWAEKLSELRTRIAGLKPLTLWLEPFDESFVFQRSLYELLEELAGRTAKVPDKCVEAKASAKCVFLVLLAVALNSGSHDRIVPFPLYL